LGTDAGPPCPKKPPRTHISMIATHPIRAIAFDMGGTLEDLYYDDVLRLDATCGLQELLRDRGLDPGLGLPALMATVLKGMGAYQAWREETEIELPPKKVWADYVFPNHDVPRERLWAAAEEIAVYYETHFYQRSLRPEAPATLAALRLAGYRLGIISNVLSRQLVPCKLGEYGIAEFFDPVVTSASFGRRKPDPRIFAEAARLMHLPPAACAYVGDTISRDVIGARRAGYGMAIQIQSFLTEKVDRAAPGLQLGAAFVPDVVISDLRQVLDCIQIPVEALRDC